jgi:8-oxo-dGTP diphosphatase
MRVVAAVILRRFPDGSVRVLAGQRDRPEALAGRWEFPGGKVEPGEDDRAALIREIREELAVELDHLVPLGDELPMTGIADGFWQPFLATTAGQPTPVDHRELRWLTAEELPGMHWLTTDVPVLPRVIAAMSTMPPPGP